MAKKPKNSDSKTKPEKKSGSKKPRKAKAGKAPSARSQTAKLSTQSLKRPKKKLKDLPPIEIPPEWAEAMELARGSTEKGIITANVAIDAIASERTNQARATQEEEEEEPPPPVNTPPKAEQRRSAKDLFTEFREQYGSHDPEDPLSAWRQARGFSRHSLASGVSVGDLAQVESRLSVSFPTSYWDFCLEWGSGELFTAPFRGWRFISGLDVEREISSRLKDSIPETHLPVVKLGPGDYLALDLRHGDAAGECPVVWWFESEPEELNNRVAESFLDLIKKLSASHGDTYWLSPETTEA